jgi:hypothetical protein
MCIFLLFWFCFWDIVFLSLSLFSFQLHFPFVVAFVLLLYGFSFIHRISFCACAIWFACLLLFLHLTCIDFLVFVSLLFSNFSLLSLVVACWRLVLGLCFCFCFINTNYYFFFLSNHCQGLSTWYLTCIYLTYLSSIGRDNSIKTSLNFLLFYSLLIYINAREKLLSFFLSFSLSSRRLRSPQHPRTSMRTSRISVESIALDTTSKSLVVKSLDEVGGSTQHFSILSHGPFLSNAVSKAFPPREHQPSR